MLLVLLATLPSVTVAWVFVATTLSEYRRDNEMRLQETSRALALAVDREIATLTVALNVLATSPSLDSTADLAQFHDRTRRAADALGARVALYRPDGEQLLATWRPFGPIIETHQQIDVLREVVADGHPRVTDAYVSERLGIPVAKVLVPVMRDGRVVGVLDMLLTLQRLSELLAEQTLHPGAFVAVSDGQGMIVAGTSSIAERVDTKVPDWLRSTASVPTRTRAAGALIRTERDRMSRGAWSDGVERVCAVRALSLATTWRVSVCETGREYDATWEVPLLLRMLGTAAALVSAAVAAAVLAQRLVRPLTELTRNAEAVALAGISHAAMDTATLAQQGMRTSRVAEFAALQESLQRAERVLLRRGQAERAALLDARNSQQLLASVVNNAAEEISVKDLDGRYLLVNRAVLLGLGMRPGQEAELIGRRPDEVLPAATARKVMTTDREVLAAQRVLAIDYPFVTHSGASRHLAVTKVPWYDASGKLAGIVTVARDVSVERAADSRLRRLQGALQRATRLSAMGAMASGLAHEVNQPLAASTNFLNAAARLLERVNASGQEGRDVDGGPGDSFDHAAFETARIAVADASSQLLRAGQIVRRLRDFVGRGETELQEERIDSLVAEAASLAQVDGMPTGIELRTDVAADCGSVPMDRTQMLQVLLNLIRNAAEAIQSAAGEAGPVGIVTVAASRRPDASVAIVVSDTGPGFPGDIHMRLFEPFVSTKPNGMGIGLVICRTIVEGLGGYISAISGEPEYGGAVFTIVLPAPPHFGAAQPVPLGQGTAGDIHV